MFFNEFLIKSYHGAHQWDFGLLLWIVIYLVPKWVKLHLCKVPKIFIFHSNLMGIVSLNSSWYELTDKCRRILCSSFRFRTTRGQSGQNSTFTEYLNFLFISKSHIFDVCIIEESTVSNIILYLHLLYMYTYLTCLS